MPTYLAEVSLASLENLITNIKLAVTWLFGLFGTVVETISTNDLLLYPVLLAITISAVALVLRIVKKFGLRPRRS